MNPKHQIFILEMIKHGNKVQAYQKAYPKAKNYSATKAAERLLRIPAIANEIEHAVAAIRNDAYKEAYQLCLAEQKTLLLSVMKKREILTQIATCEMKVGRYVKEEDGYRMVYEDPRPRDIIKAIEVDTHLEEACNRVRNTKDTQLSNFDIYIDRRLCDDPNGAINYDIPTGLVMLPKKKKSYQYSGNKKEQNAQIMSLADTCGIPEQNNLQHVSPLGACPELDSGGKGENAFLSPAGGGDFNEVGGGTLAKDNSQNIAVSSAGAGVFAEDGGGTFAKDTSHHQLLSLKYQLIHERQSAIMNDPVSQSFYKRLTDANNFQQLSFCHQKTG